MPCSMTVSALGSPACGDPAGNVAECRLAGDVARPHHAGVDSVMLHVLLKA